MRLLTLFLPTLALSTLFPAPVSSIHPHALTHRRDHARSPASSIIASRQYRVPRDLLDVCINVNANLLADASQLLGLSSLLGALNLGADIKLCLCLKDLDLYLDTKDQLSALIGLLGKDTVGALITALINTSKDAKQCTFPQHAHHTCNTSDPCHYACDPPYVNEGGQCVCASPNISCNGVCGEFPQGCSSAVPRSLTKKSKAITTLAQAQAYCKSGETVCGISGRESTLLYECVDTSSTKDSCGGCMAPHPFFEAEPVRVASGKDCSTIANTKSTSCSSYRCVVNDCKEGWVPTPQKDACIPSVAELKIRRIRKRSGSAVVDTSSNTDIDSQITTIVKSVIAMNIHGPATALSSSLTSYSTEDLANLDSISGLLEGVNADTAGLVTSTSILTVVSYANNLLNMSSLLRSTVNDCHCVTSLGIQTFSSDVDDLVNGIGRLLTLCKEHPNGGLTPPLSLGSSASVPSSSPDASGLPIIVGLTTLLSSPGKSGVVIDGLVGPDTAKSVNNILNGLNLGPANYKRQVVPPISAVVNATVGGNSGLLNQLTVIVNLVINLTGSAPAASPTVASSSTAQSVGSTGSTSSLSNCLIDPIIFATLYQYSINLIASPDLDSFCRNTGTLYAAECSLRDLFNECPYVDTLGLEGIEADLLLVIEETQYLDDWCIANIAPGHGGNSGAGHSSPVSTPASTSTPSSSIAGTIVSVSGGVSASSVGVSSGVVFVSGSTTSRAVSATSGTSIGVPSTVSIPTSPTVSVTLGTYTGISSSVSIPTHYSTSGISSAPATTQSTLAVHPLPTSTSSTAVVTATDIPIVVSADDVLSDLGLSGTKAVVTVDGLLGNNVDESVDHILDGLSLGPHNVRRTLNKASRQIVANVNATVNLGGLGGLVDGLVDLVLGLNNVGSTLLPVSTLVHVPPASIPALSVPLRPLPVPLPPLSDPVPALSNPSSTPIDQALVTDVVAALLSLLSLQSPTYSQFLQALNELVAASSSSAEIMNGCSCMADGEGYEDVYRYLVDIAEAAEALEALCRERAGGAISSSTGVGPAQSATLAGADASHSATPTGEASASQSSASTSPSADDPIVVGLTKLLKGLGLNIDAKVVVDGLLGNSLNHAVNTILNGLGIGPNGARRRKTSEQDW
ncbi:hypothetical protein CVT25_012974 [Psilocybe cyanescens]|uniref:Protein CPL1-like domain-containing protein n=1 Tax=Psilocybe cyanescens TaxID=93625 RepID=A0A409VTV5_PSICY|nr:hypothetical protein CVT25_012974 [Psilocybe cyanescens]